MQEGRWGWAIVAAEAVAGAAASAGASIIETVGELASLIRREDGEGEPGNSKPKRGVCNGSPVVKAYARGGCDALCMHDVSCSITAAEPMGGSARPAHNAIAQDFALLFNSILLLLHL